MSLKLSTLPSKIAFSKVSIESPKGRTITIPRRELFDIRLQLIAEDESEAENLISNLDKSDLRTNVYEGGFKSWECSFDLARLLLDRGPRKDLDDLCRVDHVIEVSAIPEFYPTNWPNGKSDTQNLFRWAAVQPCQP